MAAASCSVCPNVSDVPVCKMCIRDRSPTEAADAYLPYVEDLMGRLDLDWDVGLTPISVHDRVEIDGRRRELSHQVKQLFVADRDDVDHYWIYYQSTGQPYVEGCLLYTSRCV